jgi:hypothetical protein
MESRSKMSVAYRTALTPSRFNRPAYFIPSAPDRAKIAALRADGLSWAKIEGF